MVRNPDPPSENRVGFGGPKSCPSPEPSITREEMTATEKPNGRHRAKPITLPAWVGGALRALVLPGSILLAGWWVSSAINKLAGVIAVK